jgi:hypothetical protein
MLPDSYSGALKLRTSLDTANNLELVIRIKQQKYNYKYKNVHDLLVNGYYFKEEIADKFVQLAASHTPEECPD